MNAESARAYATHRQAALAVAKGNLPRYSLARCMYKGYVRTPQKQMVVTSHDGITYADAWRKANVLAWYLYRECQVHAGSYVAIAASNGLFVPVAMAAAQMCGAHIVQVPPGLAVDELSQYLAHIPVLAFLSSSAALCDVMARIDPSCALLSIGGFRGSLPTVEDAASRQLFGSNWEFPAIADETCIVLFSSGSTGTPKAIVNRAHSFGLNGRALRHALSLTPDDVVYVPVPFAHVFGIVGMYAALACGGTIVTSAKYRPETALSLISNTRATVHLGVATMFLRELRENQDGDWNLSSLRAGLVAGAGCPESVLYDFEERYACRIMQSYGMTETAATLTVTDLDLPVAVRARCVGVPVAGAQVKLAPETNEILCKTPSLMVGILQPDGSCALDLDEDGWFASGDVGAYDEGGRLRVVGRIKDIVIRGGINIFPAEVEALYEGCADVAESCLVGYPDPELGERTCLCVVLAPGSTASALDLRQFAVGRTEKCRIPDVVMKLADFPRLANGKIDKRSLRDHVKQVFGA